MAEFGQILLLVLTVAWISQSVPKSSPPTTPDTLQTIEQVKLILTKPAYVDTIDCKEPYDY